MSEHQDLPRGDEEYYRLATIEFDRGWKDEAVWAKAMALCDGDEQRARYRYIRLRAQQFIEAERQKAESAAASTEHPVADQDVPDLPMIHGWSTAKVQRRQQRTAERLNCPVEFLDQLEDGTAAPEMVLIPSGRFLMGSPDDEADREKDERQHEVAIEQPFGLGRYPVTFEDYDRFCYATGRKTPRDKGWGRGRRPVINIDWDDAMDYCQWLSEQTGRAYRLPSEAEWEYACRAGTASPFYFGATISTVQAKFQNLGKTVSVGQFPANAWGLHDMHGNVWEWTGSAFDENYTGSEKWLLTDEAPENIRRAIRGGSWYNQAAFLRSASRNRLLPSHFDDNRGFRLACSLDGDESAKLSVPDRERHVSGNAVRIPSAQSPARSDHGPISDPVSTGQARQTTSPPAAKTHHTSGTEISQPTHGSNYRFVDPATLTSWLRILLLLGLFMTLIALWSNYQEYQFLDDIKTGAYTSQAQLVADAEVHDQRQRSVFLASIGLRIATVIVFLMWVYRLNANLWAHGLRDLKFTPGWAVGWYFVPVLNLWKPYQAMKEIVVGTGLDVHPVVHWWWFFWISSTVLNVVVFRMAGVADPSIDWLISTSVMIMVAEAVEFASILVALSLVQEALDTQPKPPRLSMPWPVVIILAVLAIFVAGYIFR